VIGRYYKLVDKVPVPVASLLEATTDEPARRVALTQIGDVTVSTVFLVFDHAWGAGRRPLLFETMVFGGEHDEFQERCCTWDEALEMHERACVMVRRRCD